MDPRHRFRPDGWDALEGRVAPSPLARPSIGGKPAAQVRRIPHPSPAMPRPSARKPAHPAPADEINRQFDAFTADLATASGAYLDALSTAGAVGATDEATQLQVYMGRRVQEMTQDLVTYFNRLPIALPKAPGPYRVERPRNAIQQFVGDRLFGPDPSSLISVLLATPVPTGGGPSVALYESTLSVAIETARQEVLEGVRLTFAGADVLGRGTTTPTIPAR